MRRDAATRAELLPGKYVLQRLGELVAPNRRDTNHLLHDLHSKLTLLLFGPTLLGLLHQLLVQDLSGLVDDTVDQVLERRRGVMKIELHLQLVLLAEQFSPLALKYLELLVELGE